MRSRSRRETLANAVLRDALSETATAAKEGRGLAEPLARSARFPQLAIHLLAVGEKSGHLEAMLLKIAEIFDREVRSTLERLMTLLVPALTIGLGHCHRVDHRRGAGRDPLGVPAAAVTDRGWRPAALGRPGQTARSIAGSRLY